MKLATFTDHLKSLSAYRGQIAHIEHIPARQARYGDLEKPLHPALKAGLLYNSVERLYAHQAEAVNAARNGSNVIVSTSTASGKTLCYNIPVLDAIANEPRSRALYLFPTKALAQDQLRSLGELVGDIMPGIKFATFDGDTPGHQRGQVKRSCQIVLTNPDMLHLGILPNHGSWSTLFRQLKFVVIDEAHTYRGVFGSHVANILRRLRRICRAYGSDPRFILCTATIANPKDHAEELLGLPVTVVDDDGSPHGSKDFVLWNPPFVDRAGTARRSANSEATLLFSELVRKGIRNITFAKSRKVAELIYLYAKEAIGEGNDALTGRISPYRAGYLPEDRRQIEKRLFQGRLLGVTATTALELGVDIGDLDATVLTGFPGTIASTWQQAGRSGRGSGHSLSFLIGLDNPLDQYLMRHPEAIFQKSHENALINPKNPRILKQHLLCAAYEAPVGASDTALFGDGLGELIDELAVENRMAKRGEKWHISPAVQYPAQDMTIRSTSSRTYVIVDASRGASGGGTEMETLDESTAFYQIHPGAIYLHQGEAYFIERLDLEERVAYARKTDAPYYTQAKEVADLRIAKLYRSKRLRDVEVCFGEVEVTTEVIAFKKKRIFSEEVIAEEPLDLPAHSFVTEALWFDVPTACRQQVEAKKGDFAGGLHAVEHATIALLPLFAMCDRRDIGGLSTATHPDTGKPQVFIHDAQAGGIGIAERGFGLIEDLWKATLQAITECPCEEGCPSCIQSPKCGNNNEPLDKNAAKSILKALQ